jgi:hypothetical protein
MNRIRYLLLVVGLVLLVIDGITGLAQDIGDIPFITIVATAEGFTVPEEMPEGVIQITFENNSDVPIQLFVARLNEGVTFEDLGAALEQGGEEAALPLVSLLGGVSVTPGAARDVVYDFAPGMYLLVNERGEDDSLQPFSVVESEGEGAAPPEADVEVPLVDFAFNAPIAVAAGPQVWHIVNQGTQPHHMIVIPLDDNMPAGEINNLMLRVLAGEEVGEIEPSDAMSVAPLSPGEQIWVSYDLEPGTYALVCALPDFSGSGRIHVELGMRQVIIATE